jgi:general secretion pathway protein E
MERLSDRRAEPTTLPGGGDSPTARPIDDLIAEAVRRGATHVHFEARAGDLVVRMRIGGVLRETLRMPESGAAAIMGRIKALARLDPAALVAQEGRLAFAVDGTPVDLGVSTLPGSACERLVLRLLARVEPGHDLGLLGMPPAVARLYRDALAEPDVAALLSPDEIEARFDLGYHLKHVDTIFERVFGED